MLLRRRGYSWQEIYDTTLAEYHVECMVIWDPAYQSQPAGDGRRVIACDEDYDVQAFWS